MTQREERLKRLSVLRELQHDAAAAALRVANGTLQSATATLQRQLGAAPMARSAMRYAVQTANQDDWLMARADAAWGTLSVGLSRRQCDTAQRAVTDAAVCEVEARRASMQMKSAVEDLQCEREQESVRSEQRTLDEIARHLRQALPHALTMRRIP